MKRLLVAAGALTLASALPALPTQDPYYYFHEGICSTSLTDQVPLFEKSLSEHPAHNESRHGLGVVYYRRGDLRQAIDTFESELDHGRGSKMTDYDLACCYALSGDHAKAVAHLKRAVRRGFRDWALFRGDRDMDAIRGEPDVIKIAGRTLATGDSSSERDDIVKSSSRHSGKAKPAAAAPAASGTAAPAPAAAPKAKKPKKEKPAKTKKPKKDASAASSAGAPTPPAPAAAPDAAKPAGAPDPANPLEEPSTPAAPASAAPPVAPPMPGPPPPPPAPGSKTGK